MKIPNIETYKEEKLKFRVKCNKCNNTIKGTSIKHVLHNLTQHQEKCKGLGKLNKQENKNV